MKFGKRLQEEVVPEWADYYVSYKRLKQFIHNSELRGTEFSAELFRIISEEMAKAETLFEDLLAELQKGHDELLELDISRPVANLRRSNKFYRRGRSGRTSLAAASEGAEEVPLLSASSAGGDGESGVDGDDSVPSGRRRGVFGLLKQLFLRVIGDSRVRPVDANTPRAVYLEWYSHAHQLQHFAELNLEAFRKAAKKLKKYRRMEADFTAPIEAELGRSKLTTLMPRVSHMVESVQVDFERKFHQPLDQYASVQLTQEYTCRWGYLLVSVILFVLVLKTPITESVPAQHCAALFTLVISLWITEAMPFFCTAMLIPLFAVPLGIIADPATGKSATPTVASQVILGKVFNHVQILVMGGLTIGKACARTNLEMYAASALHRWTAHRPAMYLLGVMVASCVLCAFVSNVAAPLLVLGVIQRTLWEFPEGTKAPHGILLGLAFACNLGGMLSPIASPQNAVAMNVLSFHNVSFAAWVGVALPLVFACLLVTWATILVVWKPFDGVPYIPLQVVNAEADRAVSTSTRAIVLLVSLVTIVLWILPANLFFGDTGIVALIPIVVFFGTGILSKEDFNTLSWHLMFLLAGGNMLGLCARDSHMLDLAATQMKGVLMTANPFITLIVIVFGVGAITTFVSHTVAAMILLPIVVKIGFLMPESDGLLGVTPQALVMLCALMCSGAMAFPISSFPNVNSLLAEDERGTPYLQAKNFLLCGSIIQGVLTLCLVSWMLPVANVVLG